MSPGHRDTQKHADAVPTAWLDYHEVVGNSSVMAFWPRCDKLSEIFNAVERFDTWLSGSVHESRRRD